MSRAATQKNGSIKDTSYVFGWTGSIYQGIWKLKNCPAFDSLVGDGLRQNYEVNYPRRNSGSSK